MQLLEIFVYSLIGIVVGFLGGMLGIGGGLIMVPALVLAFQYFGNVAYDMHVVIGTTLAAMVFTAASSAIAHANKKGVYWDLFAILGIGVPLGAALGALAAYNLSSEKLELIFGISIILFGLYFLFAKEYESRDESKMPRSTYLFFISIAIGVASSILGIGGGLLLVPFLTFFGVPIRNAISTSAMTGFIIAFTGSLFYFLFGLLANHQTGYIHWPAFLVIGISSVLFAPLGAKLTYFLPSRTLRIIFGIFLILVGVWMIY